MAWRREGCKGRVDSGGERTRCGQNETETARKINKKLMFCALNHCRGVSLSLLLSPLLSRTHAHDCLHPLFYAPGLLGQFYCPISVRRFEWWPSVRQCAQFAVAVARCSQGSRCPPPHSPLPLPQPLLVLAFMLISGSATNCSRIAIFYDSLHRTIFTTWPHLAN